jgi:hypothetical protein
MRQSRQLCYPKFDMTDLLKRAFEKAAQELPEHEQDAIGRWVLDAIENEEKLWDTAFARSPEKLDRLEQ